MTKLAPGKTHVFWTGGWDSTFRVVQLLMTTDEVVQPHFIIRDEGSTGIEINAMNHIRRLISREYTSVFPRLLPTIYTNALLVEKDGNIQNQIEEFKRNNKIIDPQYVLMANYCKQFSIEEIELGVETNPGEIIEEWRDTFLPDSPAFKSFTYPISNLKKVDMLEIAKKNDWLKILSLTSFCRKPIIKVVPCGVCGPCVDAVVYGMGFRLPLRSRIKAMIQRPFRVIWRNHYHKNPNNRFFQFVKKKLEGKF